MKKPYVICHMVMSIDGKVTGEFLNKTHHDIYYQINRDYNADAYACGRVTMEGSFTNGYYPNLDEYDPVENYEDYIVREKSGFYALAFDPHGRLGWMSNHIIDVDEDPGYDNAQIIEVLTHQVDARYLGYLRSMGISYVFGGAESINVEEALIKLSQYYNINKILLEGGSIINGAFMDEDLIDELSLVINPITAADTDKPLFMKSHIVEFELKELKQFENGVLWLNYIKKWKTWEDN